MFSGLENGFLEQEYIIPALIDGIPTRME